jgi:peptidoglycan LD-endopeptidase LytH
VRRTGRCVLVVALAAALPAATVPPAAAADSVEDLERLREERELLEARVDAIAEEFESVQLRIEDGHARRARLAVEVAELEATAGRAAELLKARAVHVWTSNQAGPLDAIMSSEGPDAVLERMRLLDSMGRNEQQAIEAAQSAREALGQRQAEFDTLLAELTADEARLAELRSEYDDAFRVAWTREKEIESRRDRQRRVSRDRQRGVYACPIAPPFHFRDTWGAPRSGGRKHKGVDIFGPMGQEVYAITDGVVSRHSTSRLGGLGLYLAGDDGNVYYYSHLSSVLPGYLPGRRVEAGEWIASNGDSGNARGGAPHIHMEVRPGGGSNVNPYPFAAASCF